MLKDAIGYTYTHTHTQDIEVHGRTLDRRTDGRQHDDKSRPTACSSLVTYCLPRTTDSDNNKLFLRGCLTNEPVPSAPALGTGVR